MLPSVVKNQSETSVQPLSTDAWVWSKKPIEVRAKELVAKGDSLIGRGQLDDALESYNEALMLSPGMVEAKIGQSAVYGQQGTALVNSGKYSEALRILKQSTEIYPDNYLSHFQLGRAYSLLKQERSALNEFNIATTLKPDFALAYYAKGLTLIRLEEVDLALYEVTILRRLDPQLADELFEILNKTMLSSKLATLRQELESQGTFSTPSQSGSVSMTQMGSSCRDVFRDVNSVGVRAAQRLPPTIPHPLLWRTTPILTST